MTEILSLVILVLFVAGLWVGSTTTLIRTIGYLRNGHPMPTLLPRDLIVSGGLATSFLFVALGRGLVALGTVPAYLTAQWWWVLLTSVPALIAVWTYTYYELFVIERNGP